MNTVSQEPHSMSSVRNNHNKQTVFFAGVDNTLD